MGEIMSVLWYGIGTVLGFLMIGALIFLMIHDVTQQKHTVSRHCHDLNAACAPEFDKSHVCDYNRKSQTACSN